MSFHELLKKELRTLEVNNRPIPLKKKEMTVADHLQRMDAMNSTQEIRMKIEGSLSNNSIL